VKKELRRAAKKARRAARTIRPDVVVQPSITIPPEGIPILWVEPTGVERYHRGFHCRECKAFTEQDMPGEAIEEYRRICAPKWEWPEPRPTIRCKCGATVAMNSAGLDAEYHAPSTGEVFERIRDLPHGAVWAQKVWREDRELNNWISHRDEDGTPFPPPKEGEGGRIRFLDRPHEDDGRVLIVRLPDGHDWEIDSRANNCTLPLDDAHWCWNRSGRPEDRTLDVRKGKPGQTTCGAGGGSIQTGRWHGFLHGGKLVQA
jgi:hypothetical protein